MSGGTRSCYKENQACAYGRESGGRGDGRESSVVMTVEWSRIDGG